MADLLGQAPQHFLYFLPLPQVQGAFLPTFADTRLTVFTAASAPPFDSLLAKVEGDAAGSLNSSFVGRAFGRDSIVGSCTGWRRKR